MEKICPSCQKPLGPDVPLGLCPECLIKAGIGSGTEPSADGFVPPTVEEITRLFPQFEILGFLGKGGMGAVYKARQPALDRLVALKVLPPTVANDPGFAERFNREARALARLNHPNIVAVHDFGRAGELHYLLMELVDGTNLRELERVGRLTPEQALAIVPQICEALQFAHNEGIVHRDIKPENLLIDKKGRVKITDFGIAKILGVEGGKVSLTGVKDVVGTPHYMAPEQIEQPQAVDHRADIYSLGVVFYEMLTGELPLGKFQPPSQKVQMDVRLDEVVLRSLEKEAARRYQHVSEVKTQVETIASTPPAAFPSAISIPPGQATSGKIILPAFLLALFFGVFGAHRFYVGKIGSAIAQLCALGTCVLMIIACTTDWDWQPTLGISLGVMICGCGIWATVDWILIVCKAFTDGEGKRITHWVHPNASAPRPAFTAQGTRLSNPPPIAGKSPGDRKGMIVAPAIALMVAGTLKIFSALKVLLLFSGPVDGLANEIFSSSGISTAFHLGNSIIVSTVIFALIPAPFIIFGAVEMSRIRSYGWALAAAILSIVSLGFVGVPVGIWALIVLMRADVREAFANSPGPSSPPIAKWPWVVAAAVATGLLFILAITLFNYSTEKTAAGSFSSKPDADPPANDAPGNAVNNANEQTIAVGAAKDFTKSLAVGPIGKLTLNVDRGDVQVAASDQNTAEVHVVREVTRASDSEAITILKEEHVVLHQNGNEISITADNPPSLHRNSWFPPNLNVHYKLTVPRKFDVRLETLGGDVKVADIQGSVYAKTAGGRLDFDDVGGKVDGQTLGGDIRATGCKNELVIHTLGGDVTVEGFAGPNIEATTAGGSISADFASSPKSNCNLHTMGGDVTARIPQTAAVTLDAHTLGGDVRTDLPVQIEGQLHDNSLQGTINGGGPVLKLKTMGGSIKVLKRKGETK